MNHVDGISRERSAYRVNPDVISEELEGKLVLVHAGTNDIYELNTTAARFWQLLELHGDLGEVERQLLAEYEVEKSVIEAELTKVLEFLLERELVVIDSIA